MDNELGKGLKSKITQRILFSTTECNLMRRGGGNQKRANEFGFEYVKFEKPNNIQLKKFDS